MTALTIQGDARRLPLPDGSVDLIVTSPPYFNLRSYQDNGSHFAGQIGSEPTPQEFLEALWACTAEWMRILKPSGSIFVNLGDKYAQAEERSRNGNGNRVQTDCVTKPVLGGRTYTLGKKENGVPRKSLIGLPWRYAIGCIDQLGLILRAEIVLDKRNGLPESVSDRVRRSHEQVFHFTKQPRYYAAVDEIREPHADTSTHAATRRSRTDARLSGVGAGQTSAANLLGKLPGSVWPYTSEPLQVPEHLGVSHFAAFNTALPRQIILGWSPSGICTACGEGRRPTVLRGPQPPEPDRPGATRLAVGQAGNGTIGFRNSRLSGQEWNAFRAANPDTLTGYACGCPAPDAPTRPSVILDPFGGTGTTALCASVLGRIGLSVDMSMDYSRLAQWRTSDPGQRAKAARVDKPPVQAAGQESFDLFGDPA